MTASVILGACLPQKPPAFTARPNPYVIGNGSVGPVGDRLDRGRFLVPANPGGLRAVLLPGLLTRRF